MVGIDILEVARIDKLDIQPFVKRVFTQSEQDYIFRHNYNHQTIAGLFCAKEAVVKAIGCGIGNGVAFIDVEITHDSNGQPQVRLHNKLKQLLTAKDCKSVFVSISHTATTAVAVAVLR